MSDPRRRSPLAHRARLEAAGLGLRERLFERLSILRGERAAIAGPVSAATGLTLPGEAGGSDRAGDAAALWLGPDEWLLVEALPVALEGHHQLVEVGDYYTGVEVAGADAREALAKLVNLDLHRRTFRPGEVAGTLLAKAPVWLWCTGDDAFLVLVRRSLADYAWCLLADAGREWGLPAEAPIGRVTLHPTT